MLKFYLFLYVFSINIPVFYHGAILAGFLSAFHYLFKFKKAPAVNRYQFLVANLYVIIFMYLAFFVLITGLKDVTFFKTFFNSFLTAMCGIPLAAFYSEQRRKDGIVVLTNDLIYIFLIQTYLASVIMVTPELKPIASFFQRQPEMAAFADIFSGGVRTNFISGPLFFGLSTMYGIIVVLLLWRYVFDTKRSLSKTMVQLLVLNVGLLMAGRAGFIYLLGFVVIHLFRPLKYSVIKMIVALLIMVGFLYWLIDFAAGYDETIYSLQKYAFEFINSYMESGVFSTHSTNQLSEMYQLDVPYYEFLLGHAHYTNQDGTYYMHTDVGYLRKMLFAGVPLVVLSFIFTFVLLYPLIISQIRASSKPYNIFGYATFLMVVVLEFKGEVMLTLVSVNSMLFLIASVYFSQNKKTAHSVFVTERKE